LTWRFAGFLLFNAALNEVVWRTQSNDTWVTFDTFVPIGLTLLFVVAQAPLLKRYALPSTNDATVD
jgi:intracellular septation protein